MKKQVQMAMVGAIVCLHSSFALGEMRCPDWISNLNEKEYVDLLYGTRSDITWGLGNEREKDELKSDFKYYVFKVVPGPKMVLPSICEKTNIHIAPVHVSQQIEGKLGDRCEYHYVKSWDHHEATPENTFYLEVVQIEPVP
jgi:hypothetical protein